MIPATWTHSISINWYGQNLKKLYIYISVSDYIICSTSWIIQLPVGKDITSSVHGYTVHNLVSTYCTICYIVSISPQHNQKLFYSLTWAGSLQILGTPVSVGKTPMTVSAHSCSVWATLTSLHSTKRSSMAANNVSLVHIRSSGRVIGHITYGMILPGGPHIGGTSTLPPGVQPLHWAITGALITKFFLVSFLVKQDYNCITPCFGSCSLCIYFENKFLHLYFMIGLLIFNLPSGISLFTYQYFV